MKSVFKALSVICCLAIAGCMVMPESNPPVQATDYGPPPPENYENIVKADLISPLFENETAKYHITAPVKAHTTHSRFMDWPKYGWAVCGTVDRKPIPRGYNGYDGPMPFFVLFNNGQIIDKLVASRTDIDGVPTDEANKIIYKVCHGG